MASDKRVVVLNKDSKRTSSGGVNKNMNTLLDNFDKKDLLKNIYKGLNKQQKLVLDHNDGPAMIIAGAGTGKTSVVTRRMARLILENHAAPEQILALTFTDKAAKEMEIRLDRLLPMGVTNTAVMTFHSFGQSILQDYCFELGLMPNARVLSDMQKAIIVKNIMLGQINNLEHFKPSGGHIVLPREFSQYFERLKDHGYDEQKLSKYIDSMPLKNDNELPLPDKDDSVLLLNKQKYQEVLLIYRAYVNYCREHNYIDYGDMMLMTKKLLEEDILSAQQIRARYKFIIVDEYQDTNLIQAQIIDLLVNNKKGNIMIVGDDDQSIYSFRSARVDNIINFSSSYPDLKKIVLIDNYRNSQPILDLAYRLIKNNNPHRLEYSEQVNKRLVARSTIADSVLGAVEPKMYVADDIIEEINTIVKEIKTLVGAGVDYADIAVLTRDKKHYKMLENIFHQNQIPLYVNKEVNVLDQPEIKAILSSLGAILNPRDSQRIFAFLISEITNLDSSDLIRLNLLLSRYYLDLSHYLYQDSELNKHNLLKDFGYDMEYVMDNEDSGDNPKKTKYSQDIRIIEEIEELLKQIKIIYQPYLDLINYLSTEITSLSVGQMAYRLVSDSGYLQRLVSDIEDNVEAATKVQNISRFFSSIHDFEEVNDDNTTINFWKHIEDIKIIRNEDWIHEHLDNEIHGVQLMTIHKSKGLEFEAVFIPFCNQGVFPKGNKREFLEVPDHVISSDEYIREERRLMYVAMTRAKSYLMLSFAQNIGGKSVRKGSIFLQEAFGIHDHKKIDKTTMVRLDNIHYFASNNQKQVLDFAQTLYVGSTLYLTTHNIIEYLYSPKEFGYWYLLKFIKPKHHHMTVGNAIHAGVEYIYNAVLSNRDYNLDEGIRIINSELRIDDFMSKQHFEDQRDRLIDKYKEYFIFSTNIINKYEIVDIEQSFNWYVKDIDMFIKGRIDMVVKDKDSGAISLIDFKSSTFKPGTNYSNKQDYKIQLLIYKYAFESLFDQEVGNCYIDFVTEPKLVHINTDSFDWLHEQLSVVRQGIDNREFSDPGQSHIDFNRLF